MEILVDRKDRFIRKIFHLYVEATIEKTRKLQENDPGVSLALKSTTETLLMLMTVLIN